MNSSIEKMVATTEEYLVEDCLSRLEFRFHRKIHGRILLLDRSLLSEVNRPTKERMANRLYSAITGLCTVHNGASDHPLIALPPIYPI